MKREDFPDDEDGDAMWRVASNGSDLKIPMKIDFAVAAPRDERKEQIQNITAEHGFLSNLDWDEESQELTCYCSKIMILDHTELLKTQELLNQMTKPLGGYCDGWGTSGN
jgi:hypothetical protein